MNNTQEYKTYIIVNPNSANGNTGRKLDHLNTILKPLGNYQIKLTERISHATDLTKQAISDGYNRIIAVGGDGTINEIVNGFFENEKIINPDCILGFIPYGTGSDFVKSINLPKKENDIINKILTGNTKNIDIGSSTFQINNKNKTRLFINVANIGLGGEVVAKVNQTSKVFGGFASFLFGTVSTVFNYKNKKVDITFDNKLKVSEIMSNIVVGNGKFCGGGMKFLPDASLEDGLFDVLTIGDITIQDFFMQIPKVYSGNHLKDPKMTVRKAREVFIECNEKLKVDLDGEQEGYTSASFRLLQDKLKIIV